MTPILCALAAITLFQAKELESEVKSKPTATGFRSLALADVDAQQFGKASDAFEAAAKRYEQIGDSNAAKVLRDQSLRYASDIQAFVERPPELAKSNSTRCRLEPDFGCYFGVNIEQDDDTKDPSEFDDRVGKTQSLFFIYHRYGDQFPSRYADQMKQLGAGLQIAWEPSDLDKVQDDEQLRQFALDAKASGIPIFLRFASEMNGDWTSYHQDPKKYIEKFRVVADEMHRSAPNVAMVWCPNETPQSSIASYYPGDDAVDWVGVNFYSVLYNDGDRARESSWRNPADSLKFVYSRYSAKHPMMIGEWGATHESVVDHLDRSDFAIEKIRQLYATLPRQYPRVKAVLWLSMNTEKYATGDRKLNDFSLTDSPDVLKAYGEATSSSYYLDKVDSKTETVTIPLSDSITLHGSEKLSFLARSFDSAAQVRYSFGNLPPLDGGKINGPRSFQIDTTQLKNGPSKLVLEVVDSANEVVAKQNIKVVIAN